MTTTAATGIQVDPATLLKHWQGHRSLTRRTIEAFPEDKLFSYSIGGMRPFAEMVYEFLGMAVPGTRGIATGQWDKWADAGHVNTKVALLQQWDKATEQINEIWPSVPAHRWLEEDSAFGQWPGTCLSFIFYFLDNEVHHRGQGFVYLRSLGIEPPAFYEREGF